ncbi:MAG: hypothetical protein K2L83_07645 [Muribaculaceae bacterium]|nr:hypothetical protein [Muribaculaceae bacterium]
MKTGIKNIASLTVLAGCILTGVIFSAGDGEKKRIEAAAAARREWHDALRDSIARITNLREKDSLEIISLRTRIDELLPEFTPVENPREVEPYYILSALRGSYPLRSTGIAARVTASQRFELIAALNGQGFDAIRVVAPDGTSATSATVAHDQALNYTSGSLTTVAFTAGPSDNIGRLVEARGDAPLTLDFLRGGKCVASHKLSDAQKRWISTTWRLADCRKSLDSLENASTINSRKLGILVMRENQQLLEVNR